MRKAEAVISGGCLFSRSEYRTEAIAVAVPSGEGYVWQEHKGSKRGRRTYGTSVLALSAACDALGYKLADDWVKVGA